MNCFFLHLLQGMFIGAGAILPGVSGGMLCLLFGVYEPVMAALAKPSTAFVHRRLFLPLALGGLVGFFLLAGGVGWAFEQDPAAATCLFLGLIAGSAPKLAQDAGGFRGRWFATGLLSTLGLLVLAGRLRLDVAPTPVWFFVCGAVWGLSLVLPGLPSSTLLIFLGLYQPMAAGVADFDLGCILPLCAGIALTVLVTARGVNRLLEKQRGPLLNLILGAVCASSLMILPLEYGGWAHGLFCLMCALWGFGCAVGLEMLG